MKKLDNKKINEIFSDIIICINAIKEMKKGFEEILELDDLEKIKEICKENMKKYEEKRIEI